MKTIRCGVRCEYWNRAQYFEIQVEDDATEEDIEKELYSVALQEASFDCWVEDQADE